MQDCSHSYENSSWKQQNSEESSFYSSGPRLKEGTARILPGQKPGEDHIVIVGLGKDDRTEESKREGHDLSREAVRKAVATGVRALKYMGVLSWRAALRSQKPKLWFEFQGVNEILVDGCGDDEAAAEGSHLALWAYDDLKAKKDSLKKDLQINPLSGNEGHGWNSGLQRAKGQNLARTLMETPANYMTPQLFAEVCSIRLYNFKLKATSLSLLESETRA